LHLRLGIVDSKQNEGDQGHAGDAIGFEAVGAGANANKPTLAPPALEPSPIPDICS
jgi:hypothetical protein